MNIYVGNLSYNITEEDLQQAFAAFGQVASTAIITDQFSGRSKGFGFGNARKGRGPGRHRRFERENDE